MAKPEEVPVIEQDEEAAGEQNEAVDTAELAAALRSLGIESDDSRWIRSVTTSARDIKRDTYGAAKQQEFAKRLS
jgi:hypothetical protein